MSRSVVDIVEVTLIICFVRWLFWRVFRRLFK